MTEIASPGKDAATANLEQLHGDVGAVKKEK